MQMIQPMLPQRHLMPEENLLLETNFKKVFIRPILEYSCVLFEHVDQKLLNKIQAIETEAIKIAHNIAPWTSNYWCYSYINFTPVLERLKNLAKKFLDKNKKDEAQFTKQ